MDDNHENMLFRNIDNLPAVKKCPSTTDRDSYLQLLFSLDKSNYAPITAFNNAVLLSYYYPTFEYVYSPPSEETFQEMSKSKTDWSAQVFDSKHLPESIENLTAFYQYFIEFSEQNINTETDLMTVLTNNMDRNYDPYMTYEVIDNKNPNQFLTAHAEDSFGDWTLMRYDLVNRSIWTHQNSGFFRPPGWCMFVGHPLYSSLQYADNSVIVLLDDAEIQNVFAKHVAVEKNLPNDFKVGMKLEVLDPFDYCMRIGTVEHILRFGFMQIKLEYGEKTLVFHITSAHIYPAFFCELNDLPIPMANGKEFSWKEYKLQPNESIAPVKLFPPKSYANHFKAKMIVETFNMRGHGVFSAAIVLRTVGRILHLSYLSQNTKVGLYVDVHSPHIMPIGFTNLLQEQHNFVHFDVIPLGKCLCSFDNLYLMLTFCFTDIIKLNFNNAIQNIKVSKKNSSEVKLPCDETKD